MNKLKVVLLCHYWSKETEQMLGLKHYFRELSPWIQEYINLYKNKEDIELHVLAPNYTANKNISIFKEEIYYHFYHYAPTVLSSFIVPIIKYKLKHNEPYKIAERSANVLTNFRTVEKNVTKKITSINPHVIHVFGTENPDYSAGVLPLMGKYPILITIQGYAYLAENRPMYLDNKFQLIRRRLEKEINTNASYIIVSSISPDMPEFKPFENGQKRFLSGGNITKIPNVDAEQTEKKYDISFYGRVTPDKGVEDLVRAIGIIYGKGLSLKTLIIGKCTPAYQEKLRAMAETYKAGSMIHFTGFVEDHDDVYKYAASAKMVALPTHVDLMPNTIREALAMGLPVVASDAGYISSLNNDRECVALHRVGDIEDLACKILKVISDNSYRQMLIDNGRLTFSEKFSMSKVYSRSIEIYKDVFDDYNKKMGFD